MKLSICKNIPIQSLPNYIIPLSVLLASKDNKKHLLTQFHQIYFDKIKEELHFSSPKICLTELRKDLFRHCSFKLNPNRLIHINLFEIITSSIKNGYYVYTFSEVNEANPEFWSLIYGFNTQSQTVSVLLNKKDSGFQYFDMSITDLNKDKNMFFMGIFKLRQDTLSPDTSISEVKNSIAQYLDSKENTEKVLGIVAFEWLSKYLYKIINQNQKLHIPSFMTLKEHKLLMLGRLEYLSENNAIASNIHNDYKNIYQWSKDVYLLCQQYNETLNKDTLIKTKNTLDEILKAEKDLLAKTISHTT